VIKQIHERMVQMPARTGWTDGRRMRVDTTVVETNVHYPGRIEFVSGPE